MTIHTNTTQPPRTMTKHEQVLLRAVQELPY